MRQRNLKRAKLVAKYKDERFALKAIIKTEKDRDKRMAAQNKLASLPRDSSPVRFNTICQQCSRQHAVYSKFEICRICIRQQLMTANIPGGKKSSW